MNELSTQTRELQLLEHNLHTLLAQRQTFEIELGEIVNALSEVKDAEGDVFRVIGSAMVKSNKEKLTKELEEKSKIIEMRIQSIQRQEHVFESKIEELKKQVLEEQEDSSSKE